MRDTQDELEKKRKRSEQSSVSEADTSATSETPPKESKREKKLRKKLESEQNTKKEETKPDQNMDKIHKELKTITEKMLTKGDPELSKMIKESFSSMKEEFLRPVTRQIEVLETKLFDRQKENDELKEKVETLEKKLEEEGDENKRLKREIEKGLKKVEMNFMERTNQLEQYSRRNNIRIDGVSGRDDETSSTTIDKVVKMVNDNIDNVKIRRSDIDIAHRVGKKTVDKQIIVKFVSREKKNEIMKNKKSLGGTDFSINEDLTKLNQHAMTCVRKKLPEEIQKTWSRDGKIKYKNTSGTVHTLKFEEYQRWFDLPWPVTAEVVTEDDGEDEM